jgi:hypothetical protein
MMTEARAQQREARLERRISELERAAVADQARIAELEPRFEVTERRADAAETHAQAAETRALKMEDEATKERAQLRKDFIELGDDLRARTRDASAAAVVELQSQVVSVEERLRKVPSPLPVAKDWAPRYGHISRRCRHPQRRYPAGDQGHCAGAGRTGLCLPCPRRPQWQVGRFRHA